MEKSALFVIGSPLQAISALDAIKHLKIRAAEFIIYDIDIRLPQTLKVLALGGITNSQIRKIPPKNRLIISFILGFFSKSSFDLMFVGDYRVFQHKLMLINQLKKGGRIITLDDGNITIPILKAGWHARTIKQRIYMLFFGWCAKFRGISDNDFFTLFYNIDSNFTIIPNNSFFSNKIKTEIKRKELFVIGTLLPAYNEELKLNYTVNWYLDRIFNYFRTVYPDYQMVYIPHGRDNSKEIFEYCKKHNVEYRKLGTCVELFCLENGFPEVVAGFTSSALYTIKSLNNNVQTYNMWFGGDNRNSEYAIINEVYTKSNIKFVNLA